jgi:hypothetical protein
MKQHIRELLERRDSESLDYRGVMNGDTYQRYSNRCKSSGIEPRPFREWLAWELSNVHPGRRLYLDDHQRAEAMQVTA